MLASHAIEKVTVRAGAELKTGRRYNNTKITTIIFLLWYNNLVFYYGLNHPAKNKEDIMKLTDEQLMDFNSGMTALADKHYTLALKLLTPLAEMGVAEAQHRVAVMYQNGLGVAVNPQQAAKWMRQSADNGYDLALHGMGFMYLEGEGVKKDPVEAAKWFKRGVEKGLIGSMTVLAEMYQQGNGVEKDPQQAKQLLSQAGF